MSFPACAQLQYPSPRSTPGPTMSATAFGPTPALASATTPLLYGSIRPVTGPYVVEPAPAPPAAAPQPAVNRAQRVAIGVLAALHVARGLVMLAYPLSGFSGLDIPRSGAAFLLSALLGVRDALLGGLLATTDRFSDHEVRRALAVNLLSDAADTFILIFSAACRWQPHHPVAAIGLVATMAIVEHLTLWTMSDDDEGGSPRGAAAYEAHLQANEDKKRRLDMWFDDMRRSDEMRQSCCSPKLMQDEQHRV
ncbi:hypothetical protein HIM_02998 [Hirsutella minnesotensis 3608]|nr:hypothetical protein HIM_02998 [Hirsutella minnesotensis 3608]